MDRKKIVGSASPPNELTNAERTGALKIKKYDNTMYADDTPLIQCMQMIAPELITFDHLAPDYQVPVPWGGNGNLST